MFCRIVRTRLKNSCTSPISIINSNRNNVWTSPGFQKNGGCLNEWLYVASLALSTKNPSLHAVCCNFHRLSIRKCLKSRVTLQKCQRIPNTLSAIWHARLASQPSPECHGVGFLPVGRTFQYAKSLIFMTQHTKIDFAISRLCSLTINSHYVLI